MVMTVSVGTTAATAEPVKVKSRTAYWLIAPGVIWMALFLVLPILMMIYVSFWTQTTFRIEPKLTLQSWQTFFSSDTYLSALWTTIRIWLTVLACIERGMRLRAVELRCEGLCCVRRRTGKIRFRTSAKPWRSRLSTSD